MVAKLENVWFEKSREQRSLTLDWSNERHHRVVIQQPGTPQQVADALREMAALVLSDQRLSTKNQQ